MRLYNYTALDDEQDKIYSIGGTKISSTGISMASIKVIGPFVVFGVFLLFLVCKIAGKQFWNPVSDSFNEYIIAACIGIPTAIGFGLFYIRIQTYRLYKWLYGRIKPKYYYNNEGLFLKKRQKYTNFSINGEIKKIL